MSKHTPGPWGSLILSNGSFAVAQQPFTERDVQKRRIRIATVHTEASPMDARLIAAAPELLEACKALIDLANENEVQPRSRDWQIFQTLLKASNAGVLAKAAIAKAEGK